MSITLAFPPFWQQELLGQRQDADPARQASRPPVSFAEPGRPQPGRPDGQTESYLSFLRRRLSKSAPEVRSFVEINPAVMHGNPVFSGSRIPLYQIIEELAETTTIERLREGHPTLTTKQIVAGLDFASSLLRIYDDQAFDR
jgi:uncharacterized protein (DUF433 family)